LEHSDFKKVFYTYPTSGTDPYGKLLISYPETIQFLPPCRMQTRLEMRILSAYLSVHLSVKRVNCDKTEEKSVQIFYHAKDHLA